jgi:ATP-dependent Clp protease ATP-binding subunit ClpC
MAETTESKAALTPGAQRLVELALQKQQGEKHAQTGAYHWLLALLERHAGMAERLAQGLEAAPLQSHLKQRLREGDLGQPLDQETVILQAGERARARGKEQAVESDVAAVILAAAGYTLKEVPASSSTPVAPPSARPAAGGELEELINQHLGVGGSPGAASASPSAQASGYQPRSRRPTPTLEEFGRDLTREAASGKLPPVVGREDEIQLVLETLCRRTKRNPVLVGPAGVGKTAIVEGLAQRVVRGEVPEALKGTRVLALLPSALVAGSGMVGELQKRMQAVLAEANQEGIIVFIDEVHSIVGAGGREGSGDIASQLKPPLARGEIACIAATTDDEYRRYIEPDAALERRFQPIRVQELSAAQTLAILKALREDLARLRSVEVPDALLEWLVQFAGEFLRNRYFPDKAVDLLEQCVAYAVTQNKHLLTQADAETVAQRMVGMPIALDQRLQSLRERLSEGALLSTDDTNSLLNRLEVTLRGLDLRPARPSAVVLLTGEALSHKKALAEAIAETLFGAAERIVSIDFGRLTQDHDLSMLIGAPPGYVGYSENLPLHRVAQMPWCVVRCESIHACHPQVRAVLQQALADGFLTDAQGKRIYLSDAVVLLTAELASGSGRLIGFHGPSEAPGQDWKRAVERTFGEAFADQVDVICAGGTNSEQARRDWLEHHLLADLASRCLKRGLRLHWDESIIRWILERQESEANKRDWERLVEADLTPLLVRYLPSPQDPETRSLRVKWERNTLTVEPIEDEERSN